MEIDWINQPYDHAGTWEKNQISIMNPSDKITWPQFIVEMIIYNRSKYIKDFPKITIGSGWSAQLGIQIKNLSQQAYIICNYFPHPKDEPMVIVAFRNYFRINRVMKLGPPRKNRTAKSISDVEKYLVKGIWAELNKLIKQRESIREVTKVEIKKENIIFRGSGDDKKKGKTLADLIEKEKNNGKT